MEIAPSSNDQLHVCPLATTISSSESSVHIEKRVLEEQSQLVEDIDANRTPGISDTIVNISNPIPDNNDTVLELSDNIDQEEHFEDEQRLQQSITVTHLDPSLTVGELTAGTVPPVETTTGSTNTTTNTKLGPFKCDKCEKRFRKLSELKTHIRSHTGEQPFQCHICGKRFTQSSNLGKHIRNLHINPKANSRSNQKMGSMNHNAVSSTTSDAARPKGNVHISLNDNSLLPANHHQPVTSSSNTVSSSSSSYIDEPRKDYGYKCFHQGCPATFTNNNDLKLHIFETAPTILAEMNVMKANILELTGILKRWDKSTETERAAYLQYAQIIERATLDFSIADIAAMNISGNETSHSHVQPTSIQTPPVNPAPVQRQSHDYSHNNQAQQYAYDYSHNNQVRQQAHNYGHNNQVQQHAHSYGHNNQAQQHAHNHNQVQQQQLSQHQQQFHPFQQNQLASHKSEDQGWEMDNLDMKFQDEEGEEIEGLGFKRGRYDISCGWPDLDSTFFGKDL